MVKTVLILGASGKIGAHSKRAFTAAGWQVRLFNRATDDMVAAAQGVDVIVNGLNPPNYHNWKEIIPAITRQVIAAAKASGATVIVPGNVYNFGDRPGLWGMDTPQEPVSQKGRIRVEMEEAYRRSGVQTIILRAGNFIDPDHNADIVTLAMMQGIARGKLSYPGDPDTMQAYAYLPDWARAAAMLAEKRGELAVFEDIPFPGHAFTATEYATYLSGYLNRKIVVSKFPWWVMRLAAPFWELARELVEMRYLWNTNHRLDGRKLAQLLPDFEPTGTEEVMRAGLPDDIHPNDPVPGAARVAA